MELHVGVRECPFEHAGDRQVFTQLNSLLSIVKCMMMCLLIIRNIVFGVLSNGSRSSLARLELSPTPITEEALLEFRHRLLNSQLRRLHRQTLLPGTRPPIALPTQEKIPDARIEKPAKLIHASALGTRISGPQTRSQSSQPELVNLTVIPQLFLTKERPWKYTGASPSQ